MEVIVKSVERKEPTLGLSTPRGATHLDVAHVDVKQGNTELQFGFSRYSTENQWYLDIQMTNGLPVFCHGEGSRSCSKQVAQGLLQEAIDNAEITNLIGD